MRYLSARHTSGERTVYVAVLVAKLRHQIEVLEATEMQRGLVTAQAISQGLSTAGRVVLDGIQFDHDRAVLKSESRPALEVIAAYLTCAPSSSGIRTRPGLSRTTSSCRACGRRRSWPRW
jgi:hypothetical protein